MYKKHYSHFLSANPNRLHFAAHSHHLWPDVTREAQLQYWDDSAKLADKKWDYIFATVLPKAQQHIASILGLQRPEDICFAPNTHSFVARLFSCFDQTKPLRILTTDSEFHSFSRQVKRCEELATVSVTRVPLLPTLSFEQRFLTALHSSSYELVFMSHVFYNLGFVVQNLAHIVNAVTNPETLIAIDGYHSFLALPTNLQAIEKRTFYLGGAYKYAQAGEGACFMSIPERCALRPFDTGWFASFEDLESDHSQQKPVSYTNSGYRFFGATFDPSGIYRLNAVFDWLKKENLSVKVIHQYVQDLQKYFLSTLSKHSSNLLPFSALIEKSLDSQGHFLVFDCGDSLTAKKTFEELNRRDIIVDYRANYLRIGFGLYQDFSDIDEFITRI